MTKCTKDTTKNTSTKKELIVPQESSVSELSDDRMQGNGKNRRSVEGPEDYISHDTDDLKWKIKKIMTQRAKNTTTHTSTPKRKRPTKQRGTFGDTNNTVQKRTSQLHKQAHAKAQKKTHAQ